MPEVDPLAAILDKCEDILEKVDQVLAAINALSEEREEDVEQDRRRFERPAAAEERP